MKEGICESCTYTKVDYTLVRDDNGWTKSITWLCKLYNNVNYQKQTIVIDADGNTEEHIVPTVTEDNLLNTESVTYVIPFHQATQATHEEPHVQENELAFQAAYRTWADTHRESEDGKAFWNTFNGE